MTDGTARDAAARDVDRSDDQPARAVTVSTGKVTASRVRNTDRSRARQLVASAAHATATRMRSTATRLDVLAERLASAAGQQRVLPPSPSSYPQVGALLDRGSANVSAPARQAAPSPGQSQPAATPTDFEVNEAVSGDDRVARRFWSHVVLIPGSSCAWWVGAISGHGHGRFWVRSKADGSDHVVVAHRFAYALAHGRAALEAAPMLTHRCDNPLCVNVNDLQVGDALSNGQEWATRRPPHREPAA
ncbi:hypothetical protein INN71_01235 [Nocardioides sp. ChNu-153]|uniref:hypothetical protein n=1 Tax=unclassified Nocardioides TaxID=2615069 RepID=UPI002405B256|nr:MULTISPECIES: hypothetical protein [unclassified Nocardioides]MDF9714866.1 HNH endonuclease [Nocardioides sp. ChNu-99]MDN7120008.1 hypothetical protein [Nocardioides sp. ChNu-153]